MVWHYKLNSCIYKNMPLPKLIWQGHSITGTGYFYFFPDSIPESVSLFLIFFSFDLKLLPKSRLKDMLTMKSGLRFFEKATCL